MIKENKYDGFHHCRTWDHCFIDIAQIWIRNTSSPKTTDCENLRFGSYGEMDNNGCEHTMTDYTRGTIFLNITTM